MTKTSYEPQGYFPPNKTLANDLNLANVPVITATELETRAGSFIDDLKQRIIEFNQKYPCFKNETSEVAFPQPGITGEVPTPESLQKSKAVFCEYMAAHYQIIPD